MKNIVIILCLLASFTLKAQEKQSSGLNAKEFHKYWKVESEAADYKVTFLGDTAEIVSPKGLTLWRREKMAMCVLPTITMNSEMSLSRCLLPLIC